MVDAEKVLAVLRKIEWEGSHHDGYDFVAGCIECGVNRTAAHKSDCQLSTLIAAAEHEIATGGWKPGSEPPRFAQPTWLRDNEIAALADLANEQDMTWVQVMRQALRFYQLSVFAGREGYRTRMVNDAGEDFSQSMGCKSFEDYTPTLAWHDLPPLPEQATATEEEAR